MKKIDQALIDISKHIEKCNCISKSKQNQLLKRVELIESYLERDKPEEM